MNIKMAAPKRRITFSRGFESAVARIAPEFQLKKLVQHARKLGLTRGRMVVSLDCDTPEDTKCVLEVDERLRDLGITPVYAVPGEILRQGASAYEVVLSRGGRFMNHGGRTHTFWDERPGRYASCFFYDEMSRSEVEDDIRLGHSLLREVLGVSAEGFRTPHFGTFSSSSDLRFLHGVLARMGYKYSSSSLPWVGLRRGPVFRDETGLVEIPVSGRFSRPTTVLDSWSVWGSPQPSLLENQFEIELDSFRVLGGESPFILNIYADPSHIQGKSAFFSGLDALCDVFEPNLFEDLLELV